MAASDTELLSLYTTRRDAGAFAEIVSQHRDLVYAACLRVVHNAEDAEDLTQECFLRLARKAASIRGSIAGWLHRTAVNASIDKVRQDRARVEREQVATELAEGDRADDATWAELEPEIDRAIDALPDNLREPLVLHFLEGKDQIVVAKELGMSRFAVARRLSKGVDELRGRLKRAGVVVSATALAALLSGNAVQAAPATVVASLGKLSLAGILPEGPAVGAGTEVIEGVLGTSTAKTVFTILLTLIVGAILYNMIQGAAGGKGKVPLKVPVQEPVPDTQEQPQQQMKQQAPLDQGQGVNVNTAPQGDGVGGQRGTMGRAGGELQAVIKEAGGTEKVPPQKEK